MQGIGRVRPQSTGVDPLGFLVHILCEFVRRRVLAIDLVAQTPGKNAGMVTVARNHFPQLFKAILHDVWIGFVRHILERVGAPCGHFGLNKDAMPVAVVEHALILRPVDAGKHAIQVLKIIVVMIDPRTWLCHPIVGITPCHALNSHETHALTVQPERTILHFDTSYAERGLAFVACSRSVHSDRQ